MSAPSADVRTHLADIADAHGWTRRRMSGESDRYTRLGHALTVSYLDGQVGYVRHVYLDGAGTLRRDVPNVDGVPVGDPATLALLAERVLVDPQAGAS